MSPETTDFGSLLDALEREQTGLHAELGNIATDDWFRPTPAKGWDVRDTVAHLADIDEIAIDTCTGRTPAAQRLRGAVRVARGHDAVGCAPRASAVRHVRCWRGGRTPRRASATCLQALDPAMRVPWGIGMRRPSLVTARLMETWAHGLDVREALGLPVVDSDRLRHVAWLGYRALPYAFSFAGRERPPGELRVELTSPSGDETWEYGPADAPNRITGPAGELCRLFAQRISRDEAQRARRRGRRRGRGPRGGAGVPVAIG